MDKETGNLLLLRNVFTNTTGHYNSGPVTNDDGDDDGLDIVVRFMAFNQSTMVTNSTDNPFPYWDVYDGWTQVYWDRSDGPLDTEYRLVPWPERGAWMIFSYHCGIAAGWNYLKTTVDYEMLMATACWPCGDWPCYNPNNGVINLTDWSAWYPDIILHEYGHYEMHTLYRYMPTPPGGPPQEHFINETSNNVTAWVEGWANFFPLVVQNDPDLLDWNLETPLGVRLTGMRVMRLRAVLPAPYGTSSTQTMMVMIFLMMASTAYGT